MGRDAHEASDHEGACDLDWLVLSSGACVGFASEGATHGDSEFRWTVMRDPDGNEFA
jgi:hypothetical protein